MSARKEQHPNDRMRQALNDPRLRGVGVVQREKPEPDHAMNSLIRDAAGRNRRVVDQDQGDRGEEE